MLAPLPAGSSWGLSTPASKEDISCYAIVVETPEKTPAPLKCWQTSGTVLPAHRIEGLYPAGATIELEIPSGPQRRIHLLGFGATSLAACQAIASSAGVPHSLLSAPVKLASVERDLVPGDVSITLQATVNSSAAYEDCSWTNVGATPTPVASPIPTPSSSPTPLPSSTPTSTSTPTATPTATPIAISTPTPTPTPIPTPTPTPTPPPAPTSITLTTPATSPGSSSIPTITVGGVESGDTVYLYSDSACTSGVGSNSATGSTVDIIASLVGDGPYQFYAKRVASNGLSSTCSAVSASYVLDTLPPVAAISGAPTGISSLIALNITVGGSDVSTYRYKIGASGTVDCSTETGYSGDIGVATHISNNISALSNGSVTLCVVGKDAVGNQQGFASATTSTWNKQYAALYIVNAIGVYEWGAAVLSVTLSDALSSPVTASYTSSNNTATTGLDYQAVSGSITIPAGQTSTTITVPIFPDRDYEGNEDFSVSLSSPTNAVIGNANATVTINDLSHMPMTGFSTNATGVISGGYNHTCAVMADGGAKCWGTGTYGENGQGSIGPIKFPGNVVSLGAGAGVQKVVTGSAYSCALVNGGVYCWGNNSNGQLGDGTTTNRSSPVAVTGLSSGVIDIAAGESHACAVKTNNTIMCWGVGTAGQLGDGTNTNVSGPVTVINISDAVKVVAGTNYSCALLLSGAVVCWGKNTYGQLGNSANTDMNSPVSVSGLSGGVTDISASGSDGSSGGYHTCAVQAGGVKCWGYNLNGQLGNATQANSNYPVPVSGLSTGATQVVAGASHSCALKTDGTVMCWGANAEGQLGSMPNNDQSAPVTVSGLTGVASLGAGDGHTCAVLSNGSARCFGRNTWGQLGNGLDQRMTSPSGVQGLNSGVVHLDAGINHTCAVLSGGGVKCWGSNDYRELGDGSVRNRLAPVPVQNLSSGAMQVSLGEQHSCALMSNGNVMCWGTNVYGQLGLGHNVTALQATVISGFTGNTQVAAGKSHTCARTSGNNLYCWGRNNAGQLGDGSTIDKSSPVAISSLGSAVAQVALGYEFSCALLTNGTVRCWGANIDGELGDGSNVGAITPVTVSGLSNIIAIAAGASHACAVTNGGDLYCWGGNGNGQIGDGSQVSSSTPVLISSLTGQVDKVAARDRTTCVVLKNGTAKCWGWNFEGGAGNGSLGANVLSPQTVTGLAGVQLMAPSSYHSCALMVNGSVSCWGSDQLGKVGHGMNPMPHPVEVP